MKTIRSASALVLLALICQTFSQTAPQLSEDGIREVIAAMTLEEKVDLVVGMGYKATIPGLPTMSEEDAKVPERVPGAAGRTHAIPRLGIPSITFADGPAGVRIDPRREGDDRTYFATAFPVATSLASSWDRDLARAVGAAFGSEARDFGVDILLAPGMNIQRNPLGGRNFEYYSEDPLVSGSIAAGFVSGVQSKGVGTSIKHFAANNQEFNRFQSDSVVSERALREIYLKGFEIAVKEARPWTVMSSYNLINGTFASQRRDLLTDILRGEWGFQGFVMTDWWSGDDAAAQMRAGNDLLMPGTPDQEKALLEAVRSGSLDEKVLDVNVERILRIIVKTPTFRGVRSNSAPDLAANAKVARQAAAEGMVLLRNEGAALPAKPGNIALFGIRSYATIAGGTGSGDVNKAYTVPVVDGLKNAGFGVGGEQEKAYGQYLEEVKRKNGPPVPFFPNPPIPEMVVSREDAEKSAANADLAVITIGRDSGEMKDLDQERDFELSRVEAEMIRNVSEAFRAAGKKVVVLLNVGGPIETVSWRERADAILVIWQAGQEGGNAAADVVTGKVNPSGRLAVTFPRAYPDVPSAGSFPGKEIPGAKLMIRNPLAGRPAEAFYNEGIFVGYRYYTTFGVEPAYPFGHGLSYTGFSYSELKVGAGQGGNFDVTYRVANTGKTAGKEVVQLYVKGPTSEFPTPEMQLRRFGKTPVLPPGTETGGSFTLTPNDLAYFDSQRSAWVVAPGKYTVTVGGNSGGGGKSVSLEVPKEIVVKTAERLLTPEKELRELARPIHSQGSGIRSQFPNGNP